MIETAQVRLVAGNTEANITSGCPFHRLMGRITADGLELWCKGCRSGHLISWAELDCIRQSLVLSGTLCYPNR